MAAGSDRRQRLIEIGDEILGVLHADRDADEIVRNVELPLAFVRHGKMGHRGRVAGKRIGAAKADGELHDLERIEESERPRLAALQIDREGGTGPGAMTAESGRETRGKECVSTCRSSWWPQQ